MAKSFNYNDVSQDVTIRICKMAGHDLEVGNKSQQPEFWDNGLTVMQSGWCTKCHCFITLMWQPGFFLYEVRIDDFNDNEPLYTYSIGTEDENKYDDDGEVD